MGRGVKNGGAHSYQLNLRAGEWVEVRSADEILATLDERQALDGLPFMPEMLQYCGRKFRVYKSAHKTCDTVQDYAIRRMTNTVHLAENRCDGAAHAGCQAACLLYWKEAWLKRTLPHDVAANAVPEQPAERHRNALMPGTQAPSQDGEVRYRCQATDLRTFSTEVRRRGRWNPGLYVKDLTSGNVSLFDFIRYGLLAMVNAFGERFLGRRFPHVCGVGQKPMPTASMNLRVGEAVKVRSKQEIMQTVGADMKNRGLFFDVEMTPYCDNGTHRVLARVERIVDEKTGRLIVINNPCLILEGVTCSGKLSSSRMFCPRSVYPYWREVWLERAEGGREKEAEMGNAH